MEINESEDALLRRMIDDSGEMWRESRDRSQRDGGVVICTNPARAFYLTFAGNVEGNINGWVIEVHPLEMDHARGFFAAFGSHWYYFLGSIFRDGKYKLRAYIKNGRKSDWTISVEPCSAS